MLEIVYDPEANALAIEFRHGAKSARMVKVSDTVNVDFDAKGRLMTLEVLNVRSHLDAKTLATLPTHRWVTLAQAERDTGLSASTLRGLMNRERLIGEKRGRDWFVSSIELIKYMESRDVRGRPATNPRARSRRSRSAGKIAAGT
jgi:uncharacterized protein YuzE